jgi:glyoxylase-like metal-dependent hydrolase (beta-lactamase superfamily II)
MIEVADRVYRLGAELVNWYLVEDGGRFTVIDAGLNQQFDQLPGALVTLGASLDNVEAVVLTHAHADHLGSSAQIQEEAGAAVHVHESDAALARGEAERKTERGPAKDLAHPFAWKVAWWFITNGGLQAAPPVAVLSTFADGEVLDLPGSPRVIHTPGHTGGSSSIHLTERGVVCSGDAMATVNLATGATGPRIMPGSFNEDSAQCLASLSALEDVDADLLLPGHGEPWSGSMSDAVAAARRVGPS